MTTNVAERLRPSMSPVSIAAWPPAGILAIDPVLDPPRSIKPPLMVMVQSTLIASTPPVFLISPVALSNPPVSGLASSIADSSQVVAMN